MVVGCCHEKRNAVNPENLQHALDVLREAAARYKACEALEAHWHGEFNDNVDDWRKASKSRRKVIQSDLTASWYAYRAAQSLKLYWAEQHVKLWQEMNSKLIIAGQMLGSHLPDEFRPDPSQSNLL